MYMLADGTGGFVIANTNDLLGGLEKIGQGAKISTTCLDTHRRTPRRGAATY